ncbi:MAG: glutamate--tRNA ligase [Clostridia bacterium]|nr:glutamate--tRNA ligase [Clostridia bacterium]
MTENKKLADLLFPALDKTVEYYENLYPERSLPDGAIVTRFAPSPTGFLHIGGLFAALIGQRAAMRTGGVFYLRIEDTDKKREIQNGIAEIIKGLCSFGMTIDEGMISETESVGGYGPYVQSERKEIYQTYAKALVEKGLAYPCFCSEDELAKIRREQEEQKITPGYYGEFAKHRNITYEQAKAEIEAGKPFVLRLKSGGSLDAKVVFEDLIKGRIEMPENNQDIVILKTDGIPTYHFAHAVDDHLMRSTHIIRGDEWLSSAPIHLQLFDVLGFERPKYAHISPIMKEENGGKRKLSKRKDPEAAVTYYHEEGYPKEAVVEYLLTLANSNYEEWRIANPAVPNTEFPFSLSKMSQSGALFDLVKLTDISKNYISLLTKDEVYASVLEWAKQYNEKLASLLEKDEAYAKAIFAIERSPEKPRKDITKWSDAENYIAYFYDELWDEKRDFAENLSKDDMIEILEEYKKIYDDSDPQDQWFSKIRQMSEDLGYAGMPKLYRKNPENYKGHVGDVSGVIRVSVTGRRNTPDLYEILHVLGKERVMNRINDSIRLLKEEN